MEFPRALDVPVRRAGNAVRTAGYMHPCSGGRWAACVIRVLYLHCHLSLLASLRESLTTRAVLHDWTFAHDITFGANSTHTVHSGSTSGCRLSQRRRAASRRHGQRSPPSTPGLVVTRRRRTTDTASCSSSGGTAAGGPAARPAGPASRGGALVAGGRCRCGAPRADRLLPHPGHAAAPLLLVLPGAARFRLNEREAGVLCEAR